MGAVLVFTAPLIHKLFPKKNSVVELYKKELKKNVDYLKDKKEEVRLNYDEGIISASNYIMVNDSLTELVKERELKNSKLIALKVDSIRFFGWKTTRKFFIGFGVRLPFFFLTILLSFLIFKLNTKDEYLKKALFFLQVSCYALSFYYLFWVFWTSSDYSVSSYLWFFIIFSLSSSITTVYFINYREILSIKLKNIIKGLFDFILIEAEEKDYIKEESKKEYDKRSVELIKNALDNE